MTFAKKNSMLRYENTGKVIKILVRKIHQLHIEFCLDSISSLPQIASVVLTSLLGFKR